jgi:hypothetical protein
VDLICHLWQQYTNMALYPLAVSSVTTRREMTIFNNQTVSRIEGAANTLLQRMTDGKYFYVVSDCLSNHIQLQYLGFLFSSRNKRKMISNPGMTTSHLLVSTQSLVKLAVKYSRK